MVNKNDEMDDPLNGPCDCIHKEKCHIPRQYVASKIKKRRRHYQCQFYVYFEADKKQVNP